MNMPQNVSECCNCDNLVLKDQEIVANLLEACLNELDGTDMPATVQEPHVACTSNPGEVLKCQVSTLSSKINHESQDVDYASLVKPFSDVVGESKVNNSVRLILDCLTSKSPSDEIVNLLINECELMFECKMCRSIHRALPNFIAHKRFYCQELFKEHNQRMVNVASMTKLNQSNWASFMRNNHLSAQNNTKSIHNNKPSARAIPHKIININLRNRTPVLELTKTPSPLDATVEIGPQITNLLLPLPENDEQSKDSLASNNSASNSIKNKRKTSIPLNIPPKNGITHPQLPNHKTLNGAANSHPNHFLLSKLGQPNGQIPNLHFNRGAEKNGIGGTYNHVTELPPIDPNKNYLTDQSPNQFAGGNHQNYKLSTPKTNLVVRAKPIATPVDESQYVILPIIEWDGNHIWCTACPALKQSQSPEGSSAFVEHIARKHMPSGQRIKCPMCPTFIREFGILMAHMQRFHRKERLIDIFHVIRVNAQWKLYTLPLGTMKYKRNLKVQAVDLISVFSQSRLCYGKGSPVNASINTNNQPATTQSKSDTLGISAKLASSAGFINNPFKNYASSSTTVPNSVTCQGCKKMFRTRKILYKHFRTCPKSNYYKARVPTQAANDNLSSNHPPPIKQEPNLKPASLMKQQLAPKSSLTFSHVTVGAATPLNTSSTCSSSCNHTTLTSKIPTVNVVKMELFQPLGTDQPFSEPLTTKDMLTDPLTKGRTLNEVFNPLYHDRETDYYSQLSKLCKICGKCFTKQYTLFRHVARHFGLFRYKCRLCNYGFYARTEIGPHVANVHEPAHLKRGPDKLLIDLRDTAISQQRCSNATPIDFPPPHPDDEQSILSSSTIAGDECNQFNNDNESRATNCFGERRDESSMLNNNSQQQKRNRAGGEKRENDNKGLAIKNANSSFDVNDTACDHPQPQQNSNIEEEDQRSNQPFEGESSISLAQKVTINQPLPNQLPNQGVPNLQGNKRHLPIASNKAVLPNASRSKRVRMTATTSATLENEALSQIHIYNAVHSNNPSTDPSTTVESKEPVIHHKVKVEMADEVINGPATSGDIDAARVKFENALAAAAKQRHPTTTTSCNSVNHVAQTTTNSPRRTLRQPACLMGYAISGLPSARKK